MSDINLDQDFTVTRRKINQEPGFVHILLKGVFKSDGAVVLSMIGLIAVFNIFSILIIVSDRNDRERDDIDPVTGRVMFAPMAEDYQR